jgi:hypothetical protein
MKRFDELIPDRRYIIERMNHITKSDYEIIDGIFVKFIPQAFPPTAFMRNMKTKRLPNVTRCGFSNNYDVYHDIEEIRDNARKAIQSMEQRSLNLILKRLINENFEW